MLIKKNYDYVFLMFFNYYCGNILKVLYQILKLIYQTNKILLSFIKKN